jgi:serine/threonine-protein kinase
MGSVYKAEQPAMDRLVAVKILHPKLAVRRDLVSRFRREARAMSHLTHPNTVRVFLYGQLDDGSLYIVMEFLEGKNLAQVVRAEGPMDPKRAVGAVIQACGALEEAHRQGIIHRDLKPENIFLTRPGGIEDFAKVLDFGLAKVTQREMRPGSLILTQEGMVFGTPEFMSPEQAQGRTLDPRSDIYSLGIILYELVTGKLPFDAKVPMEFINLHVSAPPIPLSERCPGKAFPPDLQRVLDRSLEKDPENRYQTAAEFAAALKGIFTEKGLTGAMRAVPPSGIGPTRPALEQPAEARAQPAEEARSGSKGATAEPVSLPGRKMGSTLLLVLGGLLVFAASFALFASVAGDDAPDAGAQPPPATAIAPVAPVPAVTAAPATSVP